MAAPRLPDEAERAKPEVVATVRRLHDDLGLAHVTATNVAPRVGLDKPTAKRVLAALAREGYLERWNPEAHRNQTYRIVPERIEQGAVAVEAD